MADEQTTPKDHEPTTTPTTNEQTTPKTQNPRPQKKGKRQDYEDRALDTLKAGGKTTIGHLQKPVLTHNERVSIEDLPSKVQDFVNTLKADNIDLANVELSIYWRPAWKKSPNGRDISIHYAVMP